MPINADTQNCTSKSMVFTTVYTACAQMKWCSRTLYSKCGDSVNHFHALVLLHSPHCPLTAVSSAAVSSSSVFVSAELR